MLGSYMYSAWEFLGYKMVGSGNTADSHSDWKPVRTGLLMHIHIVCSIMVC